MWRIKTESRHMWCRGGVVEEAKLAKQEVMGSNHVACDLTRNNSETCDLMTLDDWCDYRVKIKCFAIFKSCFSDPVSKSLPSAFWHSTKTLPSARKKTLGKDAFAVTFFTECGLPSATLGKPFAECKKIFAECFRHSAKCASSVVSICMCWWEKIIH